MQALTRPFGALHYRVDGAKDAPPVVFVNSLGTDLRLWDGVLDLLPPDLRLIRFDKRGHGLSSLGDGSIADHAADAIAIIEEVARGPVVMVGLSIGGLIAQRVASDRPDLIRALVLSNTAAKLGTAESWQARIEAIQSGGLESIADAVMERWFGAAFLAARELPIWRNMLLRTPAPGYIAACRALASADQTADTARLTQPTLVIAGEKDSASPAEIVRSTADLIPGADFHLIPGAGHLPPVEMPAAWAGIVAPFLKEHT
jgi:3-oxoadipate enol-lactonase